MGLTKEQLEYRKHHIDNCPFCRGEEIRCWEPECDVDNEEYILMKYICDDCGKMWGDIFQYFTTMEVDRNGAWS